MTKNTINTGLSWSRLGALVAFVAVALAPALAFASGGGDEPKWEWYILVAGGTVNLGIFLWLIMKFGRPKIRGFLGDRKASIEKDMSEAARLRTEAEARLDEIETKMSSFDEERDSILAEYRRIGEMERDRLVADATAQAERIKEDARLTAETDAIRAQRGLEKQVLEMALELAEKAVEERMNAAAHKSLVDVTVKSLESM